MEWNIRSFVSGQARDGIGRTAVKTALYRVLMILISIAVAFAVTGRVDHALGIGLATNAVKTLTYYGYDRLWAHVEWGTA